MDIFASEGLLIPFDLRNYSSARRLALYIARKVAIAFSQS
ncbi:MAG: hypothetical protein ACI8XO_002670 [Verrucomicrobiales bacterium]